MGISRADFETMARNLSGKTRPLVQPTLFAEPEPVVVPTISPVAHYAENEFFCHGRPSPGGSKSAIPVWRKGGHLVTKVMNGRVWPIFNMVDAGGEHVEQWRKDVARQARDWMCGARPYTCPLEVHITFFIRRPLAHYGTGKFKHVLKESAAKYHTHAPDALKLARSTEDAMTGIIYNDDSQTVSLTAEKRYCGFTEWTGALVRIKTL